MRIGQSMMPSASNGGTWLAGEPRMETLRREAGALGWLLRMTIVGAVAAAIYKEMKLPPEQRTWHGRLFGFVPYDFRMPTPARIVRAWWSPRSDKVFSEQPFGVGWVVNLPVALRTLQQMRSRAR
jgi:hypothetical protein